MQCPVCNEREFEIEATFAGTVDVRFADPEDNDPDDFEVTDSEPTDSEWDDNSGVRCFGCGWSGTVADTIPSAERSEQPPPTENATLRQLALDMWWHIENVGDDTPDRTERFFALRERFRQTLQRV